MLAGVGPVRLVLFVVAADEGWRRQSRGTPGHRRRPRRGRRGDRAHETRSRRAGPPRSGRARGPRTAPRYLARRRADRLVLVALGRGDGGARRRAGRDARRGSDPRARGPTPTARRPRVHDEGIGNRRDRDAHRRHDRRRRRGRAAPIGGALADPNAPDPPPPRRDRISRLEGRREPRRNLARGHRPRRGPRAPGRLARDLRPRGEDPTGALARPTDDGARCLQAPRGIGRTGRAGPRL